MPTSSSEPVAFVLWYRPPSGGRWKKVARVTSYAEALRLVRGSGAWHIAPLRNADLATSPTLFDEMQANGPT